MRAGKSSDERLDIRPALQRQGDQLARLPSLGFSGQGRNLLRGQV
jgi:hypothetical protein